MNLFEKAKKSAQAASAISVNEDIANGESLNLNSDTVAEPINPFVERLMDEKDRIKNILVSSQGLLAANDFYVDDAIFSYDQGMYYVNRDFTKGNEFPSNIKDTFRYASKKYWVWQDVPKFKKIDFLADPEIPFNLSVDSEIRQPDDTSIVNITIKNKNLDRFSWRAYVNGATPETFNITSYGDVEIEKYDPLIPTGTLFDECFTFNQVSDNNNIYTSQAGYEFKNGYNYYIEQYENSVSAVDIPENVLPNIYSLNIEYNKRLSQQDDIHKFNTLSGQLEKEVGKLNTDTKNGFNSKLSYFEQWSKNILKVSNVAKASFSQLYSNIILSTDELEDKLAKDIESRKFLYPMMITGEMSLRKTSELAEVFKVSYNQKDFIRKIVDSNVEHELANYSLPASRRLGIYYTNYILSNHSNLTLSSVKGKFWKLEDLIEFTSKNPLVKERVVELDSYTDQMNQGTIFPGIFDVVLKAKINTLKHKYDRTYKQILSGVLCHTDEIAYKISKFEVNNFGKINEDKPVQNYYFMNSNELENFLFCDTQVKYGKKYKYVVYSYLVVYANEYEYELKSVSDDEAKIQVKKKCIPRLHEIKQYESFSVNVKDRAPTAPDIEFLPYLQNSKEILLSLQRMTGEYTEKPIQILPTDEKFIFKNIDKDGNIDYGSDDNVVAFQLFKTVTAPKSYYDFGETYKIIKSGLGSNASAYTPEVSVLENTLENVKTYYFARAIDIHGNISNPSNIYEVETVKNSGAIYHLVKLYQFPVQEKNKTKSVRKYIRITPAISQTIIRNKTIPDDLNGVFLGPYQNNVWSKKFKFRFTSTTTGRKIDIDIKFRHYSSRYLFEFAVSGASVVIEADSFTAALQLLLLEQNIDLI